MHSASPMFVLCSYIYPIKNYWSDLDNLELKWTLMKRCMKYISCGTNSRKHLSKGKLSAQVADSECLWSSCLIRHLFECFPVHGRDYIYARDLRLSMYTSEWTFYGGLSWDHPISVVENKCTKIPLCVCSCEVLVSVYHPTFNAGQRELQIFTSLLYQAHCCSPDCAPLK